MQDKVFRKDLNKSRVGSYLVMVKVLVDLSDVDGFKVDNVLGGLGALKIKKGGGSADLNIKFSTCK